MKLSVVIAAYNERENVVPLTERLRRTLDDLAVDWELLYVVEGTDGTREALEAIAREVPRIKVLYGEKPSGLGAAFRRGFAAARADADVVVTMDADLNHQPEEIPALLAAREASGADIVVGSRFVRGSSVTGIPLWKKALSGSMNAAMRFLWTLKTRDKTSGFRLYRGEVLRGLSFRNDDFAFLPELLIDASRKGCSILEVPICFTVRVNGVSKMHILKTSWSYLALLRSRWDGWSLFALAGLAGGVALRAAYAFPVHRTLGPLPAWMHVSSGALVLLAFFFLARRLVGRQAACFALLVFAFPSPAFLTWTSGLSGSGTAFLGLAALWAAAESREHPQSAALPALFGVAVGLAFWRSPQVVACAVPGALLVRRSRRGLSEATRALGLAAAGFVLGTAPWVVAYWGLYTPASLRSTYTFRPVSGPGELLPNLKRFALRLPELVVARDVEIGGTAPAGWRRAATWVLFGLNVAAVLAAFRRMPEALRCGRTIAQGLAPLGLSGALAAAFFVLSEAGQATGPATRTLLLVVPLLSACLGLLLARLSLRAFPLALALGVAVSLFNVSSYALP